jgi:hypothetical protein
VWNWRDARFGLVISAIPILIIVTGHVEVGLPMLIGALPAAAIGLLPTGAMRRRVVIIGLLFGSFLMLGSFMAQCVWVAVPGMFLLALGGSLLASKSFFGMVVLNLCVPLAGVGLSYNWSGQFNPCRLTPDNWFDNSVCLVIMFQGVSTSSCTRRDRVDE